MLMVNVGSKANFFRYFFFSFIVLNMFVPSRNFVSSYKIPEHRFFI